MRYLLNPQPSQKKPRIIGPYSTALIQEMMAAKTISSAALVCPENETQWRPVTELFAELSPDSSGSVQGMIEQLTPFIQAVQEDESLKFWFCMLEHKSPDFRAEELERLAQHTEKSKSTKHLSIIIRLLKNPVTYTIALQTARQ
jgi:hypothetical protein